MSMDFSKSDTSSQWLHSGYAAAGYFWAIAGCVIITAIATPLSQHLDQVNIVMLFLLTVLLVG